MSYFTQDNRIGRLETNLDTDLLVLLRFEGSDHVNTLYEYTVDALSTEPNIDFDALIGTHASVALKNDKHGESWFDGIVTNAQWSGVGENGNRYVLTLRPWVWLAGQRRNQRIFHNKTVVQILEELFEPYAGLGSPHLENRLVANYPELEYTVQYRETDSDFATRLMERFGISYHFTHSQQTHTMVLTDNIDEHTPLPGGSREFRGFDAHHQAEDEHFWEWATERNLTTGAIRLTDYNFKLPTAAMKTDQVGDAVYAEGQIESYDFPGDYLNHAQGKTVVGLKTIQERGQDRRIRAIGDTASLHAGLTVSLTGDLRPGMGEEPYLCLSATHSYVSQSYSSGEGQSDRYSYSGSYVLMPCSAPMVPKRKTQLPMIQGPQTAIVVGEGEIDCDEYGRILVHYHWDLQKAFSMRCRVSQNWASKGWGGMVIPRIGMEVIVEHLEGDPDKPVVTGCVYNGKNMPPYDLPKHKTRSTFRTDTHKGQGFNELRFEDEKAQEEIFIHAQKDMNIEVLNDRSKRVENDQSEIIGNDKSIEVGADHDEVIKGNMSIAVGDNPLSSTIMSKTQLLFAKAGSAMSKMKIPDPFNFAKGNMQMFVEKNKSEITGIGSSEVVGVGKSLIVGHTFQTTVGKAMSVIVRGRHDTDVGKVMNIRVGDQFTIQVGQNSSLTMSKEGNIVIKGKKIKLDADKIDMN